MSEDWQDQESRLLRDELKAARAEVEKFKAELGETQTKLRMMTRLRDSSAEEFRKLRDKVFESLSFEQYQDGARATAHYPPLVVCDTYGGSKSEALRYVYPAIGLVGEAGEVAEKVKKLLRDKQGEVSPSDREAVIKELGDVLWYVAQLSSEFGVRLEQVARINLEKLSSRQERGVISGQGDNR